MEEVFEIGEGYEGMCVAYDPPDGLTISISYDMGFAYAGEHLDRGQVEELRDFLNKVLDKMPGPDTIST